MITYLTNSIADKGYVLHTNNKGGEMDTLFQHIAILVLCLFYFVAPDSVRHIWIIFVGINAILGIIFSIKL